MRFKLLLLFNLVSLLSTCLAATCTSQQASQSFSSEEFLQPTVPSVPLNSSYSLLQELSSWSDISVFSIVISNFPDVTQILESAPNIIFVPTNDAILSVLEVPHTGIAEDAPPTLIANRLLQIFSLINVFNNSIPTLPELIQYHIVQGNFSEVELVENSPLPPRFGPLLNTSEYPTHIRDRDSMPQAARFARQITTSTGRLSIISSVLFPFGFLEALEDNGIPISDVQPEKPGPLPLFTPLQSPYNLVSARQDLRVLKTLLSFSEPLRALLDSSEHLLHLFAPTNSAFIELVSNLVPVGLDAAVLLPDREAVPDNSSEIDNFAKCLYAVWERIDNLPGIEQIIEYHLLNSSCSFDQLNGDGLQRTLLSTGELPITELQVMGNGIKDATQRPQASRIATFSTRNGFTTIIDNALFPISISVGREAFADAFENGLSVKALCAEVFPTVEPDPEDSPEAQPTDLPFDEVASTAEPNQPACFPSNATVRLSDGTQLRMADLKEGHYVEVASGVTSKVFMFTHRQRKVTALFVRIYTRSGHRLTLTPGHYLYSNGRLTAASAVKIGDSLDSEKGVTVVQKIEMVSSEGIYAPQTIHGDIIVDGIRVSCYSTAVHPMFAHALLAPIRYLTEVFESAEPVEHVGALFYDGAERTANLLPGGSVMY